jgi:hypothetical protein
MNEGKRGYREIKHVAAPRKPVKKRNPVAHAAQSVAKGAGTHKDKKRAIKHGDAKHKKSEFAMMEGAQYAHKLDLMLKMAVIEDTLSENKMPNSVAEVSNPEYDDEAGMARNSLKTMHRAIIGLAKTIDQGDNLPEWCQEKLSLAEDYLVTVWDYLQSEQGVAEAGYGRNRGYTQGFASPNAPSLGGNNYDSDGNRLGGGHDEYHVPDPVDTNTWYIRANGKIIKDRDGEPFQYRDKSAANKAALTMMAKPFNAGKKFMLTTKAVDKDDA